MCHNYIIIGLLVIILFGVLQLNNTSCNASECFSSEQDVDPGFGVELGNYINAVPEMSYDNSTFKNWNEGSFGKLVSDLEQSQTIPDIHNISV